MTHQDPGTTRPTPDEAPTAPATVLITGYGDRGAMMLVDR